VAKRCCYFDVLSLGNDEEFLEKIQNPELVARKLDEHAYERFLQAKNNNAFKIKGGNEINMYPNPNGPAITFGERTHYPCYFLNNKTGCIIYHIRPEVCRNWNCGGGEITRLTPDEIQKRINAERPWDDLL